MEEGIKAFAKLVERLHCKRDDEVVVESVLGSGPGWLKIPDGATAREVKDALYWLFNDLAIDLELTEEEKIALRELFL